MPKDSIRFKSLPLEPTSAQSDFDKKPTMIEAQDDSNTKRRRVARACDICRRKKVKCDGCQPLCTNCKNSGIECTYNETSRKRGPVKGDIESLQSRLERMEEFLQNLVPGVDLTKDFDLNWEESAEYEHVSEDEHSSPDHKSQVSQNDQRKFTPESSSVSSYPTDDLVSPLADDMGKMTLDLNGNKRYVGSSSGLHILDMLKMDQERVQPSPSPFNTDYVFKYFYDAKIYTQSQCDYEWPNGSPEFPPADVTEKLLELFFEYVYTFFPIIHKPSFLEEVKRRDQIEDPVWKSLLFNILAVGSSFATDENLFKLGFRLHASGNFYMRDVMSSTKLTAIQALIYFCIYLMELGNPPGVWMFMGMVVRCAQDMGLHRDASRWNFTPLEIVTRKRVFWGIYIFDRLLATSLGRPYAIQDYDSDVPFLEVGDGDNVNDNDIDRNREGVSNISFFIHHAKLQQIVGKILRELYSINKARIKGDLGSIEFDQEILSELDSQLNEWHEGIPKLLRWNPSEPDMHLFTQGALLQISFYANQNLIHRNFIRRRNISEYANFPSLAICINAARGTIHVMNELRKRKALMYHGLLCSHFLFMASSVLLISIWQDKMDRSASSTLDQVRVSIECFKDLAERYEFSKRFQQILTELVAVSENIINQKRDEEQKSKQQSKRQIQDTDFTVQTSMMNSMNMEGVGSNGSSSRLMSSCQETFLPNANTVMHELLMQYPNVLTNSSLMNHDVTGSLMDGNTTPHSTSDTFRPMMSSSFLLDNLALPVVSNSNKVNQNNLSNIGSVYGMNSNQRTSEGYSNLPNNMLNTAYWQIPGSMEWGDWENYLATIASTTPKTAPK